MKIESFELNSQYEGGLLYGELLLGFYVSGTSVINNSKHIGNDINKINIR